MTGFALLLRWQYLQQRQLLILIATIQVFLAVGVVYGLSYLVPHVDPGTALYLATGAPTLTLIILGLNVVPAEVTTAKLSGQYEYIAALPVSRLAPALSSVVFWLAASLPGMVLSLIVAAARFGLHLDISAVVVPAVLLVALTAAAVGYAMAATLRPQVTQQLGSFLSVILLLFAPINFPADRLPGWLQAIQRVLPIEYMAGLMRYSLTGRFGGNPALAFAVVGAWCVAAVAVISRVALRRS